MARSKDPDLYPERFRQLLLAAYNANGPLNCPAPSASEAHTFRQQLYAYVRALKHREENEFIPPAERLGKRFAQVGIKVLRDADGGFYVELINKNASPMLAGLDELLRTADTTDYAGEAAKRAARAAMEDADTGASRNSGDKSPRASRPRLADPDYRALLTKVDTPEDLNLDAVPEKLGAYYDNGADSPDKSDGEIK